MKTHHSNAQNVQSFNDDTPGSPPAKIGNPLAGTPKGYTNPANPGTAKPTIATDGTENMRAESKTEGPTQYGSAGKGQQAWPSKVDHYKETGT